MSTIIPIILCGGSGNRLWPISSRENPKQFLSIFNNKSLLEIKIEQLKKVKLIDKIVVSSDSKKAEQISREYGVFFHKRPKFFASSRCSGSNFFGKLV